MATVTTRLPFILPTLNDLLQERHTSAKLLTYYQDGMREACLMRPDLFAVDVNWGALIGVEQFLPRTLGEFLLDVYGTDESREITKGDYNTFRAFNSGWRNAPPGPAVMWMRKPGSDKAGFQDREFFLYPPQSGGQVIHACAAWLQLPTDANYPFVFPDTYLPALDAYVIYRCDAEDDEHAVQGRAAASYQKFVQVLGGGKAVKAEKVVNA